VGVRFGADGKLKIRCQRWRVGSSPTTGTKRKDRQSLSFLLVPVVAAFFAEGKKGGSAAAG